MIPIWVFVILALFFIGLALAVGAGVHKLASDKDGTVALWVEPSGPMSNAKVEYLDRDWTTGRYTFSTQNENKVEIRLLGSFNRVKHTTLVNKDDVIEIDPYHCIIGAKSLNKVLVTKIENIEKDKLMLTAERDSLFAENANLKSRLKHYVNEDVELGKKAVVIPFVAGMKKGGSGGR